MRGLFASATLDFDANTCVLDRHQTYDADLDRFRRSRLLARQHRGQARRTIADYVFTKLKLRKRGNPFQISIIDSVASFYAAIDTKTDLDSRIDALRGRETIAYSTKLIRLSGISDTEAIKPPRKALVDPPSVLVLGGNGFIARELIRQLIAEGYCVRAMIRGSSALLDELDLDQSRLDIARGDIRNQADLNLAMAGIKVVYHLAHMHGKTWDEYLRNEVEPTRLIAEACLAHGIERLIYTGSIASYYSGSRAGTITESTPLDPKLSRRGYYSRAKAESESILMNLHRMKALPVVIFRPGIVIGKGGTPFHWGVGRFSEDVCEVWGDGKHKLPFVLVEDVASALVQGLRIPKIEGCSFNLVDSPLLSAREYLDELQSCAGIALRIRYRSPWEFYIEDLLKWSVKVLVRHPDRVRIPSFGDWESRTQKVIYDSSAARDRLRWRPCSEVELLKRKGIDRALIQWRSEIVGPVIRLRDS
jgi:nucleoside-diphosphate-sugar epimerase